MIRLPRYVLDRYTLALNGITTKAAVAISKMLVDVDWSDVTAARASIEAAFEEVCYVASEEAAILAAEFYDTIRIGAIGEALGAEPYSGHNPDATNQALRGFVENAVDGNPERVQSLMVDRVGFEVSRAAGNTVLENAGNDPRNPRFARVPTGSETCNFCLALAGLGYQYKSEQTAKLNGHYHTKCDCRIVPMWGDGAIEGYDPSKSRQKFYDNIETQANKALERAQKKGIDTSFEAEYKKAYRPYSWEARKQRLENAKRRDQQSGNQPS